MRQVAWTIVALAAVCAPGPARGGETIFYTAIHPTNWDLFLFAGPEELPRRLTTDPALDYNATFSPDGRWVVFVSERRGNADLFAIDLEKPGAPRPLTENEAMDDAPAFAPDGKSLAFVSTREGNADVFVMPFRTDAPAQAEQEARNLTRHRGGDFNPVFSPDGRSIAFASDRDGYHASEIYVMQADGSSPRRLTEAPGWDGSPAWDATGERIFFYSQRLGGLHLFSMKRDGGDQRPLFPRFNFPESHSPAPAPGGRIGFTSRDNGVWRVFSARPDGTDLQRESDAGGDYWAPVFDGKGGRMICHGPADGQEAPVILGDGKRFEGTGVPGTFVVSAVRARLPDREVELRAVRAAFPAYDPASGLIVGADHFKSVITARPDGTELRRVFRPPEPRTSTWGPAWSPDGRWIATAVGPTFAGVGAPVDIWKFRPDGTGAVNLTPHAGGSDGFPFFSPDGGSIVMRSDRDGNMEIYRMGSDGANAVRLTRHDATDTMPAFSPAGDTVAFVSARDGNFEIYSLPLHPEGRPGEPRRLTDSPGHDMHPKFSPDGRWIVFASERGGLNDEEPLIPVFNPQPYGEIFALRLADGLTVRLTHNKWEDGTPSWASVR